MKSIKKMSGLVAFVFALFMLSSIIVKAQPACVDIGNGLVGCDINVNVDIIDCSNNVCASYTNKTITAGTGWSIPCTCTSICNVKITFNSIGGSSTSPTAIDLLSGLTYPVSLTLSPSNPNCTSVVVDYISGSPASFQVHP